MLADGFLDTKTLPVSGVYRVTVDPVDNATGNLTLTRHSVPADASDSLTIGGSTKSIGTTKPGQNAALTFTAGADQDLFLDLTSSTFGGDPGSGAKVSVLKPDGSELVSRSRSGRPAGRTASRRRWQARTRSSSTRRAT